MAPTLIIPDKARSQEKEVPLKKDGKKIVDPRYPSFLGTWKRSVPGVDKGPRFDTYDEPHLRRKLAILRVHPEIRNMYGYDTASAWITCASVFVQVGLAYLFGRVWTSSNIAMLFFAYSIGGSFSTLYGILIHEMAHDLSAPTTTLNRWVGMIANIPMLIPISQSFRRYHLEHHVYQGVYGYDPDLPVAWELRLVGNNPIRKFFWLVIFGVMYVTRGLALGKPLSKWELYNWVWTAFCDYFLAKLIGARGMLYLFFSVFLGYGFHPGAAHFIQEHYTLRDGQETYSYYGPGNKFWLNIGFHNEHHDFTQIPFSGLPKVRNIAHEFYDNLAYYTSWWGVLFMFISDRILAPQSRLVRTIDSHRYARRHLTLPPVGTDVEADIEEYNESHKIKKID